MGWSAARLWLSTFLFPLCRSSSGASLLWAIVAITALGGFAAAITSLSPSTMQEKLAGGRATSAFYAAMSGINYSKNMADLARVGVLGYAWTMPSLAGTYSLGNNTSFVLSVLAGTGGNYTVTSRGVVQAGSANEANYSATATINLPNLGEYNFLNPSNRPDYAVRSTDQSRDFPTGLDNASVKPSNLTVGKDYNYGFGNIWYTGNVSGVSAQGVSDLGIGFRLFFTFNFATNIGDGFVVSFLNASSNNYQSCGGDSAEGGLLGYAGDSRVYDSTSGDFSQTIKEYVDKSGLAQKGLSPPKFGVEVDTYTNNGGYWDASASTPQCTGDNNFMNDKDGSGDHVGFDYWGTDAVYQRKYCLGPGAGFQGNLKRYTDVRHGSGWNASNSSGTKLKYFPMATGVPYYFRIDVTRSGSDYTATAWVAKCNDTAARCAQQIYGDAGSTSSHVGTFSDTKTDFSGSNSKLNRLTFVNITDSFSLTSAQNTQFNRFLWGFTSGSGVATQQIDFRNISFSLR